MRESIEELKQRVRESERRRLKNQEWHGQVWKPTITDEEQKEQEKQVAAGELPF